MTRPWIKYRLILIGLLPTWLVLFAMGLAAGLGDAAYPPARLQYGSGSPYPLVLGTRSERLELSSSLRPGDRVLRWGGRSLSQAGQIGYFSAVAATTPSSHVAQVEVLRDGQLLKLSVGTESWRRLLPRVVVSPVFLIVALIVLYRSEGSALHLNLIGFLVAIAFLFAAAIANPPWLIAFSLAVQLSTVAALGFFGVRTCLMFPHGELPGGWARFLPWPFLLMGPLDVERSVGLLISQQLAHNIQFGMSNARNIIMVTSLIVNYVRSNPTDRRKIKWVIWGFYIAACIPAAASLASIGAPQLALRYYAMTASAVVIPIVLLVAILKFNLFDINRILTTTATYSITGALLLLGLMTLSPKIAAAAERTLELPQQGTQLVVSAAIVGGLWSLHRRVGPWIERLAARGKPSLASEFESMVLQLRLATTASAAMTALGENLVRVVQPNTLAIYCRSDSGWSNVFAHGPSVVPVVEDASRLVRRLEASARAWVCDSNSARATAQELSDPYTRAFVSGLGLALVIPVSRADRLFALVCVGQKSSEDIFVASEIALLNAVCQVLSERLARFEMAAVIADVRKLRDELQRYVPGAVVQSLIERGAVENGPRAVTVMFVDIRGYSGFAEGRSLPVLFSRMNQHTEVVSSIVQRHGGYVVEFNGDGMMAVFGTPHALEGKERAALRAAEEIHEGMSVPGFVQTGRLSVGVGIATGEAYVGSLRAVDRWIWTAIGETTNRAARLQTLTRDLDASIVIDEGTWQALGSSADDFHLHRGRALRGFSRRHNVFARSMLFPTAASTQGMPLVLQE